MIDDRKTSINQGDLVIKTCKETALSWDIPERTVNYMCNTGKISGAVKVGKSWQIPDTEKRAGKGDAVMLSVTMPKNPLEKVQKMPRDKRQGATIALLY